MNLILPLPNRIGHRRVRSFCYILAFTTGLTRSPPFHDNRKRASDAHKQNWEPSKALRTIGQNALADRVSVMVSDVHNDVQS
jgi:hypothetical protein